jgi:hypothetical protein
MSSRSPIPAVIWQKERWNSPDTGQLSSIPLIWRLLEARWSSWAIRRSSRWLQSVALKFAGARFSVTSERKRKTAGKRKRSSLSTTARSLYSTGGGGVDLERPQRAVDPVATAWPPSCFQAGEGWRRCESVSARWVGPTWWATAAGLRPGRFSLLFSVSFFSIFSVSFLIWIQTCL